jgi:hypothetical protein
MTDELILNPFCEITYDCSSERQRDLLIGACVRGSSTRYAIIRRDDEPELFSRLAPFASLGSQFVACRPIAPARRDPSRMSFPPEWAPRLRELGVLIAERERARQVRYICRVGSRPPRLLPIYRATVGDAPDRWVVHPGYRFISDGDARTHRSASWWELTQQGRSRPRPKILLKDPATKVVNPLWTTPSLKAIASTLVPGTRPRGLDPRTVKALGACGVLLAPAEWSVRRSKWKRLGADGRRTLSSKGYLVVRHLLLPLQVAAARRYYRHMVDEGFMPFIDAHVGRRFVSHDDPLARFYLLALRALVQQAVGRAVEPTLATVAAYQGGARLPVHRDGPTSDWNISVQLDFMPEPEDVTSWPLVLGSGTRRESFVHLGLGDAVIYRGNKTPHSRPRLGTRHQSTMLVLHYRG